jgi:hypothetical protein
LVLWQPGATALSRSTTSTQRWPLSGRLRWDRHGRPHRIALHCIAHGPLVALQELLGRPWQRKVSLLVAALEPDSALALSGTDRIAAQRSAAQRMAWHGIAWFCRGIGARTCSMFSGQSRAPGVLVSTWETGGGGKPPKGGGHWAGSTCEIWCRCRTRRSTGPTAPSSPSTAPHTAALSVPLARPARPCPHAHPANPPTHPLNVPRLLPARLGPAKC